MKKKQQDEALRYFKEHAEDWKSKAESSGYDRVNIIQQRNDYVLKVIKNRFKTEYVLDVGCGTGDLVCDIAKKGIDAIGVDYAQEMIKLSTQKAKGSKLNGAHFECCSIFDFDFSRRKYDVISANGFIEYISQEELRKFFDLVVDALAPQGSFVVGSRNRLFNILSINNYTLQELEEPDFNLLLKEAISLASGTSIEEFVKMTCAELQKPDTKHEKTGIDVTTRFQYTPIQLIQMLSKRGLRPVEIYPIHIHGVPPVFKNKRPEVHTSISNLLQSYAEHNPGLVLFSSSFMLHAQKAD
jgi:2-polyprenyl-3-methyl-5-hydroxy-6-metoxy-1,4-benzoquinol methylase